MSSITMEQVSELLAQAKNGRINKTNLQAFIRDPDYYFESLFRSVLHEYEFVVDYSKILEEIISVEGFCFPSLSRYVFKDLSMEENKKNKLKGKLIYLWRKEASYETIMYYIDSIGYRPATLKELLSFGVTFDSDFRTEKSILGLYCLGTKVFEKRNLEFPTRFAYLRSHNQINIWNNSYWTSSPNHNFSFLIVKK